MSRKLASFMAVLREELINQRVTNIFRKSGVDPFPEIELSAASQISKIPQKQILSALQNRKLAGRRVEDDYFIRIVDLWYFAVSLETEKMFSKNRR